MSAQQHRYEKQTLMNRLLDSVKQCQIRFGGKTELATELDSRVICLCSAWEAIIQHGMKHANRTLSALKQMTEMSGLSKIGLLEELKNMETEPAFWKYVKQHLSAHELQRYGRLRDVTTDAGRGRAWIRASLNEHSLERYTHMLIEDDKLLCAFYEDWSFLRDPEKKHVLPNAAAGLKSVLFAINIDNAELNTIRPARGLENIVSSASEALSASPTGSYVPGVEEPRPVIGGRESHTENRKEKRKKKKVPKIVSFDDVISDSQTVSAVSSPWTVTANQNAFSSASLPCTPKYSTSFNGFGSVETVRSFSTESSGSSKTEDSSGKPDVPVNKTADHTGHVSGIANSPDSFGDANDQRIQTNSGVDTTKEIESDSSMTKSELSEINAIEKDEQECDPLDDMKTKVTETEVKEGKENGGQAGFGLSLLRRVSSKTSLDSVVLAKSTKRDQGATVDSVPRSNPLKGHKRGHSDTSMFSNIGSRLLRSVMAVSKRKLSAEEGGVESSQAKHEDCAHEQTVLDGDSTQDGIFRSSSVGSFDNVSLMGENKNGEQVSINDASRWSTMGSDMPGCRKTDSGSHADVFTHSVQAEDSKIVTKSSVEEHVKTKNAENVKENGVDKRPLHHSFSTGTMPSNASLSSLTNFTNSIYSDYGDESAMSPVTSDGQVLAENWFRPDLNTTVSSSPSGSADFGHYQESTQQATMAIALAQQSYLMSETMRTQGDGSHFPDPVTSCMAPEDGMTAAELKEAIIAMMKRKEEVEEENRHIRYALDSELEVSNVLRAELSEAKASHQAQQERDSKKVKDVSRENELLKHQLRKYVSAVQLLRRQGARDDDFPGLHLDDVQPAIPPLKINTDFIQEAADYESKLIQVAEMHGELMEFNEFLHKQLLAKENLIKDLKQELVDLRGPLPNDIQNSADDWSIISESERSQGNRPLINVWIPAAFLKGKGSGAYHVYQVYVRIRDEEWNVYRRYTEFLDLHQFLKKRNPLVTTFEFPPKKTIGNKDEKFVEHRRKQLQMYLRKVINLIVHINATLSVEVNRHKLTQTLSFFGDLPVKKTDTRKNTQPTTRRRSEATGSRPPSEPHYSGL